MVEKCCETCGKIFKVGLHRAATAKTCSQPCRAKMLAKRVAASRPRKDCPMCGKSFSHPKCHEKRRRCCSVACAVKLDKLRTHATGKNHFNWAGGRSAIPSGYLYMHVEGHPFSSPGRRYVLEHRLVMEDLMRTLAPEHHFLIEVEGVKYLRQGIEVHHINGSKRDNRASNLLACTAASHRAIHNGAAPSVGGVWPEVNGMVPYSPSLIACICGTCGSEFERKRSRVKVGAGTFCSRACYDARPRKLFDVTPL